MTDPQQVRIDPTALVDPDAILGDGTVVWGLAQIREGAVLGAECIVGRGAYVGAGVRIGARCKIQNSALVYEPARLADGVFVGPAAVLTNDERPRATNPDGSPQDAHDWTPVGVTVGPGASIGAGAVCVAPVEIGEWAMVAAGAVVTRPVAAHSLVAGSPARHLAWIGRTGARLVPDDGAWCCPDTGERFHEESGRLIAEPPATPAAGSSVGIPTSR